MSRTEIIKKFLEEHTHPDLARLYSYEMECQVIVGQDNGQRVDGEFHGKRWMGWTDGLTTWKSFRIPRNANSEPEFVDSPLGFDLKEHAEGIGLTGWDWQNRVSKYVAYDFDSIINHAQGLSNAELNRISDAVMSLDYVTLRTSTSGNGYHIYVFLPDIETRNHNEHAALGRAILGKMSADCGYDLQTKVDACGGNMWIWHRKMRGLHLVKEGQVLTSIPPNWKDHLEVVTNKRNKVRPVFDTEDSEAEQLIGKNNQIPLDNKHLELIKYLEGIGAQAWWDSDHHMLVCHTYDLAQAHEELGMKGIFKTFSSGKEQGMDHNAFAFPMRNGAWVVRRYTKGIEEAECWDQDSSGWTRTYFNHTPDLNISSRTFGGITLAEGGFIFNDAKNAVKSAKYLGAAPNLPESMMHREAYLKTNKQDKLIMMVKREDHDDGSQMHGWYNKKGFWTKVFDVSTTHKAEPEITSEYDDIIRHAVTETGEDCGWFVKTNEGWHVEPLTHVKLVLQSMGLKNSEINVITGSNIMKCWTLVSEPFSPEYPGNRRWNRDAAQLRFTPKSSTENLEYPTWINILEHCGSHLDSAVEDDEWCVANSITKGSDYLKLWVASLFQHPKEPLPYLFFYGPQNSGKSIFHEALSLLMTNGYVRADSALINQQGFNAELEKAVLCIVEETDLNRDKNAYNRIKDWVTSLRLPVHKKMMTPYHIPNTTHWIQCANDASSCPVFTGDTRITMAYVGELESIIPKKLLMQSLEKEAASFLTEVLSIELPKTNDRLNIPALKSSDKTNLEYSNETELQTFLREECVEYRGNMILFSEFYARFYEWLDHNTRHEWTKKRLAKNLPYEKFPKGRIRKNAQVHIGNIAFKVDVENNNVENTGMVVKLKGDYLYTEKEE